MTRNTFVTEQPVVLEGYQAVMKPSKFGYSLSAIVGQDIVDQLEDDRVETLKWAESKLKNPSRPSLTLRERQSLMSMFLFTQAARSSWPFTRSHTS